MTEIDREGVVSEQVAFRLGLKPALRLVPGRALGAQRARAEARGLATEVLDGGAGRTILYIARDQARVRALVAAEAEALGGTNASFGGHRELGRLLGYPRCCVEAFIERLDRAPSPLVGAREHYCAVVDALRLTETAHGRLNPAPRSGGSCLISYYPCRFDCDLSLRYGEAVFRGLARRRPGEAESLRARLMESVAISTEGDRSTVSEAPPGAVVVRFDRW